MCVPKLLLLECYLNKILLLILGKVMRKPSLLCKAQERWKLVQEQGIVPTKSKDKEGQSIFQELKIVQSAWEQRSD